LTNWHNSIFGYKLRTDSEQLRLKIHEKLRIISLNSEFTVSYKNKSNTVPDTEPAGFFLGGERGGKRANYGEQKFLFIVCITADS